MVIDKGGRKEYLKKGEASSIIRSDGEWGD